MVQDQMRLSTSRAIFWKWALVIGLGAACAGGAVIVDAGLAVPPPLATPPEAAAITPPLEATGTASAGGTALTTASIVLPAAVETPPPATALPPEKPVEKPRSAISKIFRAREPATAGVAHFDTCLPSCETRDPQVAGLERTGLAPPPLPEAVEGPVPPPSPEGPVDFALDGGRELLGRMQGASHAVVHGTRRALDAAVGLVW